MMIPLHAGLDWTATPSLKEPLPYGPGLVAVEDEDQLEEAFEAIRIRFQFEGEVKGHDSSVEVLEAVLDALILCEARVGILLLDKRALLSGQGTLPAPALLRHQMAVVLVERFLEKQALVRLKCDDEIRGKKEWQAFRTDVARVNRRLRPNGKIKVAAYPSHQSTLIQAADCLAYVFARSVRGALDLRLRAGLRTLQDREANLFMVVESWSETL